MRVQFDGTNYVVRVTLAESAEIANAADTMAGIRFDAVVLCSIACGKAGYPPYPEEGYDIVVTPELWHATIPAAIRAGLVQLPPTSANAEEHNHYHENGQCWREIGPRGGVKTHSVVWRRKGQVKRWKRSPERFRIPVKFGIRGYDAITEDTADWVHTAESCPYGL